MEKELFLEEFDGVRSLIAADDCEAERHWWMRVFEPGDDFGGIDVYGGSLEEVAGEIVARNDAAAVIEVMMGVEDYFNPAWDRFETLDRAEKHEADTVDESVEYRYVRLTNV